MDNPVPPQMLLFFSIVFLVWFSGHAFVAWRLVASLPRGPLAVAVALVLLGCAIAFPLVLWVSRQAPSEGGLALLRALTWTYFGLFSVLFVLLIARDAAIGAAVTAVRLATGTPVDLERRQFLQSAGALMALAFTAATGVIGWRGATRIAPVVRVDVPIPGLDPRLDGFRIAQITDIHIGQPLTRAELAAIVERTNGIGADLIAVTGDLVDGRVDVFARDTDPIADLRAPHGVYFVTGNHEYYSGVKAWEAEIRARGLRVLTNEHVVVEVGGAALVVAGVTDYTAGQFIAEDASDPAKAFAGAPSEAFHLLLAHQPKSVVAAAATPAQLQLSGHTHGGQYWPFSWFIDAFHPVTSGLSSYEGVQIYVSRGTGVWGPRLRAGAPNEITELTLRAV